MLRTMPHARRTIPAAAGLGLLLALQGCATPAKPVLPMAANADCAPGPAGADKTSSGGVPGLGCVNRRNLELMVTRPTDLVRGQDLGPADGTRQANAVDAYLKDRPRSAGDAGSAPPPPTSTIVSPSSMPK